MNQYLEAKFIDNNPIPSDLDFPALWEWYGQFKEAENKVMIITNPTHCQIEAPLSDQKEEMWSATMYAVRNSYGFYKKNILSQINNILTNLRM